MTALGVTGLGMGLTFPTLNAMMMQVVNPKELSTASGVFIMGATLGLSIGVIASSSLLVGLGQPILMELIGGTATPELTVGLNTLVGSANWDLSIFADYSISETHAYLDLVRQAVTQAMSYVLYITVGLSFIALVISTQYIKRP